MYLPSQDQPFLIEPSSLNLFLGLNRTRARTTITLIFGIMASSRRSRREHIRSSRIRTTRRTRTRKREKKTGLRQVRLYQKTNIQIYTTGNTQILNQLSLLSIRFCLCIFIHLWPVVNSRMAYVTWRQLVADLFGSGWLRAFSTANSITVLLDRQYLSAWLDCQKHAYLTKSNA